MSGKSKSSNRSDSSVIEVKSKFDAEFRCFSLAKDVQNPKFDDFYKMLENMHRLANIPFLICYTDPNGDLLPINNDNNYRVALCTTKPMLRLLVQKKGESWGEVNGYGTIGRPKKNPISKFMQSETKPTKPVIQISLPEDFRRVSAIIDVNIIPETHRRVKLMKNGTDKPLGFYIQDGTSLCVTPHGVEKVPGIFVSRLVPGGLAESTGLLAVNDEVLEVNGIEVMGKTLDQVTDMMVANSSNLIITVKPVNQRNNLSLKGDTSVRSSQKSTTSLVSGQSFASNDSDEVQDFTQDEEEDEVQDLITNNNTTNSSKESNNSAEMSTTSTSSVPSNADQTVIEKDRQGSVKQSRSSDSPIITYSCELKTFY